MFRLWGLNGRVSLRVARVTRVVPVLPLLKIRVVVVTVGLPLLITLIQLLLRLRRVSTVVGRSIIMKLLGLIVAQIWRRLLLRLLSRVTLTSGTSSVLLRFSVIMIRRLIRRLRRRFRSSVPARWHGISIFRRRLELLSRVKSVIKLSSLRVR